MCRGSRHSSRCAKVLDDEAVDCAELLVDEAVVCVQLLADDEAVDCAEVPDNPVDDCATVLDDKADDCAGGPGVVLLCHLGGQRRVLPQQVLILRNSCGTEIFLLDTHL